MIRILILAILLILGLMAGWPWAFQKFVVWDTGSPGDDESAFHQLLLPLTPVAGIWEIKQDMELNSGGIIVDVRSKLEYDEGHIPGAVVIPEQTIYQQFPEKYPDKNKTFYLYGVNGYNGAAVTRLLRSMGYDKAFNIENGLTGWKKNGNKIDSLYSFPE